MAGQAPRSYVYFWVPEKEEHAEILLRRPLGSGHWRSVRGALERARLLGLDLERLVKEVDGSTIPTAL